MNEIGATADATSATGYPSLHSVPPRPRLSYTVQQERAIVDGLIADRENARYTDEVIRYRTGRSDLPPPPAPPVIAAAEPAAVTAPDGAPPPPEAIDRGAAYRKTPDDNTLHGFVDGLVQGTADQPAAGAGSDSGDEQPAGAGWFGWLRNLFGPADPPPPQPPSDQSAAGPPAVALTAAAPAEPVTSGAPADAALATLVTETVRTIQPAMATAERAAPAAAAADDQAPAAGPRQTAAADQIVSPPAAAGSAAPPSPEPGKVGIAIGDGQVAIEVAAPPTAEPPAAPGPSTDTPPAASLAATKPPAAGASAASTTVGRIAFAPGSAALPVGIGPQLADVLAMARAQGARIRIVGEAEARALALDRARAVALALVRVGARAPELEMTFARDATGDQARLLLAAGATR